MRIIVGVDEAGAYKPAVKLLGQLHFQNPAVLLLHAADVGLALPGNQPVSPESHEEYSKAIQNMGLRALDEAKDVACSWDLNVRSKFVFGKAARTLISEAGVAQADLVVVCASHRGIWSTSFLGSVSRAVSIYCRSSVLIAKGEITSKRPLRAVFATDHSAYADAALNRFIKLGSHGIDEVHVVSAYEVDDNEAEALQLNLPMIGGDVDRYLGEVVRSCNEICCAKLQTAGYKTSSIVAKGSPTDVIRQAMQNTSADLLIVGAQGGGAMEEVLIGSVALHQVAAEPYPVLLVRP